MRHTSDAASTPPGICGRYVFFLPRPSTNVIGPSWEGQTSATEPIVFRGTGSVTGQVRYGNGQPVTVDNSIVLDGKVNGG